MESMKIEQVTTEQQLEQAFHIRKIVFVEEQHVPLADEFDAFDNLDSDCTHLLLLHNHQPAGTGRIRTVDGIGKLERICLLPQYRALGFGKEIVLALEEIAQHSQLPAVKLHGQTHAENFYKKLGYEAASSVFMEDGIPHLLMKKTF